MKRLEINGDDLGAIHAKKTVAESRIWLTARTDATWWVVIEGPDHKIRSVGFVHPPQSGTILRSSGIASVTHPSTGVYIVTLTSPAPTLLQLGVFLTLQANPGEIEFGLNTTSIIAVDT